MKDWKQILYDIYAPEVGSIWAAPNGIWTNSFASNKFESDYHPSVVGKVSSCKTNCQIVPGTSKDYRKGSCVFKVKTEPNMADTLSNLYQMSFNPNWEQVSQFVNWK